MNLQDLSTPIPEQDSNHDDSFFREAGWNSMAIYFALEEGPDTNQLTSAVKSGLIYFTYVQLPEGEGCCLLATSLKITRGQAQMLHDTAQ